MKYEEAKEEHLYSKIYTPVIKELQKRWIEITENDADEWIRQSGGGK